MSFFLAFHFKPCIPNNPPSPRFSDGLGSVHNSSRGNILAQKRACRVENARKVSNLAALSPCKRAFALKSYARMKCEQTLNHLLLYNRCNAAGFFLPYSGMQEKVTQRVGWVEHRPSETLDLSTQPTPLQKAVLCHFFLHFILSHAFPTIRPPRSFQTA